MTRAYLRLDPELVDRKADYPDGAFRAYVETICFAETQPRRGRFRDDRRLRALLDRRARWISWLIDHGDLVRLDSGQLYVVGWDEWQEGDITVPERMARLRARRSGPAGDVTAAVTPTVTADVTPPDTAAGVTGRLIAKQSVAEQSVAKQSGEPYPNQPTDPPATFMGFRPRPSEPVNYENWHPTRSHPSTDGIWHRGQHDDPTCAAFREANP